MKKPLYILFLILSLSALACSNSGSDSVTPIVLQETTEVQETYEPAIVQTEEPTPVPTEAPIQLPEMTPVSGEDILAEVGTTDDDGMVKFYDEIIEQEVTISVVDHLNQSPLSNITIGFMSNGPELLIIASDSSNQHLPTVQEFKYKDLYSVLNHPKQIRNAKFAVPSAQTGIEVVIITMFVLNVAETARDWADFIGNPPEFEKWGFLHSDFCATGEQMSSGFGALLGTTSIFYGPADWIKDVSSSAKAVLNELAYLSLLTDMSFDKGFDRLSELISDYDGVVRWRMFRIPAPLNTLIPTNPPIILVPIGWCLSPLVSDDYNSVLERLLYAIEHDELSLIKTFVSEEGTAFATYGAGGYKDYSYGADDIAKLLQESSNNSEPNCVSYEYLENGLPDKLTVFIGGLEMDLLALNPTYDLNQLSNIKGFHFFLLDNGWQLEYITPIPLAAEGYLKSEDYGRSPCPQ